MSVDSFMTDSFWYAIVSMIREDYWYWAAGISTKVLDEKSSAFSSKGSSSGKCFVHLTLKRFRKASRRVRDSATMIQDLHPDFVQNVTIVMGIAFSCTDFYNLESQFGKVCSTSRNIFQVQPLPGRQEVQIQIGWEYLVQIKEEGYTIAI